jgi:predicted nuclease with TOPRIM domain
METEIGKMKHGFNEVIQECQELHNVMTDTLTNDIQDRLKAVEDALASVTQKLKDQDDTITLLKQALANGQSSFVMPMRIKIKEPEPYDGTHNAKLLETFVGTLSSTWSS